MKAWISRTHGSLFEAVEVEDPQPRGAEVVVEVTHCGLCHSDLHSWLGKTDYGSRGIVTRPVADTPIALGHEIVGRVVAVGPEANSVELGAHVIVYPWLGCGECETCRQGKDNLCAVGPRSLGFRQNGGFAGKVLVPDTRYLAEVGSLDPAVAATYACSGLTVRSAIRKIMPMAADEPVVVIGAGGLGLQAVAMLEALGHRNIVVADTDLRREAAAVEQGASRFIDLSADGSEQAIVNAVGGKVAAAIDFVNSGKTAGLAFESLRKGGTLVMVGMYGGEFGLPVYTMALLGLTLAGNITGSLEDFRDVVDLAKSGKLRPVPTRTVPIDSVNEAMAALQSGNVVGRLVLHQD